MELKEMCYIARQSKQLSQKKFAKLIDTNQTEISFIERGFIPNDEKKITLIQNYYKEATINGNNA